MYAPFSSPHPLKDGSGLGEDTAHPLGLFRKRKRSDNSDNSHAAMKLQGLLDVPMTPTHDGDYYFEDGSCILLVETTLFNVHRSMLSRDDSLFKSMLSLPQGDLTVEGRSDENPIVLPGQSASEFRNFLKALYSLPFELHAICSPGSGLSQLIDIARVSNKYTLTSLETWALDAIQTNISPTRHAPTTPPLSKARLSPGTPSSPSSSDGNEDMHILPSAIDSIDMLSDLVRLAAHCEHAHLLSTMLSLLRQLMTLSPEYAYLAISLSDELNLRSLRGAAYLEIMQQPVVVRREGEGQPKEGVVDDQGRLVVNAEQRLRLLTGYYHLTRTWEDLRATPLHFDHSPSCGATWHQHGCTQSWLEFWREKTKSDAVLALGLADVTGRLKQVAKDYDRWGSATYMHHDCRVTARRTILEAADRVEQELPDYFLPQ